MNTLSSLLSKVKGGGQVKKEQVSGEADMVLEPLMDLLDTQLANYAQRCEKTVLKKLLKELWKITISCMEKIVVLPPLTDRNVNARGKAKKSLTPHVSHGAAELMRVACSS